jgi:hypothetical protein
LSPGERQRAAADPDFISIIQTGRDADGRVPNDYERHQALFLLRGLSSHAIACLDELDSFFPNGSVIDRHLQAAGAADRKQLAQDAWFIGRLRAELRGYWLKQVYFTLGLGPAPAPLPEPQLVVPFVGL